MEEKGSFLFKFANLILLKGKGSYNYYWKLKICILISVSQGFDVELVPLKWFLMHVWDTQASILNIQIFFIVL